MSQTPREVVTRALTFDDPERTPRDLWLLPWAVQHYPAEVQALRERFPSDIGGCAEVGTPSPRAKGDPYAAGIYVDEWGCTFTNIQAGVIGEVRVPLLADIAMWRDVHPPCETLPEKPEAARELVNRSCEVAEHFVKAPCCPRPWERYQFIRGTENAMVDCMAPDEGAKELLRVIHEFHLRELEFWVRTDVDAIGFMDDWGAQSQLLIPPSRWRELFKPLYRDYCDLAHAHGKFVMMHSDGCISEIVEDLVDIGVDALNSQLFVMDMAELAQKAKGRVTFWGEIDRQHVLPSPNPQAGRDAVRTVSGHFYDPAGGMIAQLEFGPGAHPATVTAVFEEWERVDAEHGRP